MVADLALMNPVRVVMAWFVARGVPVDRASFESFTRGQKLRSDLAIRTLEDVHQMCRRCRVVVWYEHGMIRAKAPGEGARQDPSEREAT